VGHAQKFVCDIQSSRDDVIRAKSVQGQDWSTRKGRIGLNREVRRSARWGGRSLVSRIAAAFVLVAILKGFVRFSELAEMNWRRRRMTE
jgi:hypothetical protein